METGRMNAPSLSCRSAIAPFPCGCCGGRDRDGRELRHREDAEEYFVFCDVSTASFRGARLGASYEVQLHIRESMLPIVMMDSGSMLRAARNDGGRGTEALRPQHVLLHLAAVEVKERYRRVVVQGAGGEAAVEFGEHVLGHRMRVSE